MTHKEFICAVQALISGEEAARMDVMNIMLHAHFGCVVCRRKAKEAMGPHFDHEDDDQWNDLVVTLAQEEGDNLGLSANP